MMLRASFSSNAVLARPLRFLLAALTATPFVYSPGVLYPAVVPRTVYFRFLIGLAVLLFAVAWARGRISLTLDGWSRERVGLGLVAFTVVSIVSAVTGAAPVQGLLGDMIRMEGAVAWIPYLLFFFLLRHLLTDDSWPSFLRLVTGVSAVVAVWSLVQAYGESFGIALVGWGGSRVVGTLGLEGPLAIYMVLGAALAGYLATEARGRFERGCWIVVAALDLWVVGLTGTRSALVALTLATVAVAAWIVLKWDEGSLPRRLVLWSVAALGTGVLVLFLLRGLVAPGVGRLFDIGPDALASRTHLWRASWAGFLNQPFLGSGLGSFELLYDEFFRVEDYLASATAHHDRAHNVIMGVMAETGVAGLIAYLSFWGGGFCAVLAALRYSDEEPGLVWLGIGVVAYFTYLLLWFEDLASFHVLLIILAFLEHRRLVHEDRAAGWEGQSETDDGRIPGSKASVGRWSVVATITVLLGCLGWYHVEVVEAARHTREGMAARSALGPFQHFDRALAQHTPTTRAITSRYVSGLAGLAELTRSGRASPDRDSVEAVFRRGEQAVRAEIARHPDYSVAHARLARLHQARWRWSGSNEDFRAAERALRRALVASPERIRYLHRLARLHTQNGDPERAMALMERALELFPGWWETYNTMAQVQWDAGNRERAVELLLRAARTDVRYQTAGTGTQFMVRAGSWLEARGTPMQAVELFEAYLGTRYPGWDESGGPVETEVPAAALPIAARLPITLMHAGRIDEAGRAARRLRERLPPHLRRPVVTDRLDRFIADMEAGRVDRWRDAWGVLPTDVPLGG